MGNWGWFSWLGEEVEKYKLLRDMTNDESKKAAYEEIIEDLEKERKLAGE